MIRYTVAIDPGYAIRGLGCAVAVLRGSRVERAGYARPESASQESLLVAPECTVVWECPQVDSRTHRSMAAVVQLAAVGGTLAGMYAGANAGQVIAVSPQAWKGGVPKPIVHSRVWEVLDVRERALLGGAKTREAIDRAKTEGALTRWSRSGAAYYHGAAIHNLLDAVGIGLHHVGRLA